LRNQYALQKQSSAVTHEQSEPFAKTVAVAASLRDKVADFDDLFRPIRNYFYWDQHCINIPVCSAFKEIFEALDGVNELTEELTNVSGSIAKLDALQPKLLALIPPQIATQQANRELTMTNYATNSGRDNQSSAALQNSTALGEAYDASKTDDSFYLPPGSVQQSRIPARTQAFLVPGR
jgi:putative drug exporter of the RND superfamily